MRHISHFPQTYFRQPIKRKQADDYTYRSYSPFTAVFRVVSTISLCSRDAKRILRSSLIHDLALQSLQQIHLFLSFFFS